VKTKSEILASPQEFFLDYEYLCGIFNNIEHTGYQTGNRINYFPWMIYIYANPLMNSISYGNYTTRDRKT